MVTSASKTVGNKLYSYITNGWNIVDVITILLFICGMMFKLIRTDDTLEAARVILGLNLITFFIRILHIFSVHKELGPKLVMIGRMVSYILFFLGYKLIFSRIVSNNHLLRYNFTIKHALSEILTNHVAILNELRCIV